jgi:hypothetical protein
MFSTFDWIILTLSAISYIAATAAWMNNRSEKSKKIEYLSYATSFVFSFALALYLYRYFYFESKAIYWTCVIGTAAFLGHMAFLIISGLCIGIYELIFKEIFKLDFEFPNTMAIPSAIISLVFSCILLGSTLIEFPKILSQAEIEVNEARIAKAKEAAEREDAYNTFIDSLQFEDVNRVLEILPTIPSEQSYKYKCMKLQECRSELHTASLVLSDSTMSHLIMKSKSCIDNGIYEFYTNIYNWAQEDEKLIVNKVLIQVHLDLNQYHEIYDEENGVFIDIKTDGSNESDSRLNHYLYEMNIHIDSAIMYIHLYQQEYQKLLERRELRKKEKERILQEQKDKEHRPRQREEAIADSIRKEQKMQEIYKTVGVNV